ncbi:FtsQ-type POTRA domain-containing protein [Allofournierella massiliensis]|uniref:cell division protein FtsQ/DivIB n=1 Tax=Allofournierella massiliensis TaxID=1650663 RepID=UPI00399F13C4
MAKRQIRRNSGRQPAQNSGQSARRVQAVDGGRRQQQTRPAPQTGSRRREPRPVNRTARQQGSAPQPDYRRQNIRYPHGTQQYPHSEQPYPGQHTTARVRPPRRLTHSELRRRRRRRNLLMAFLGLLVVGIGVVLSLTVLFKVEIFRIENMDESTPANTGIYTEDAILGALGVPVGENMFQFSAAQKEKSMVVSLPYLERVEIRRRLPSTLVIRVEPAVETWCAQSDSGWLTLSDGLKIMAIGETQPEGLPALLGLDIEAPVAGYYLKLATPNATATPAPAASGVSSSQTSSTASTSSPSTGEENGHDPLEDVNRLLELLWTYELKDDCTSIQFGEANELYFIYQNRAKVLLGTFNNLDYKLKFAAYLLHNEDGKGIGDTEQGTLDVSHQLEDGSLRPTWSPGSITASDSAASDSVQTEPAGEGDTGQNDGTAQTDEGTDGQTDGAEGGDQAAQTDTAGAAATPEPTAEAAA